VKLSPIQSITVPATNMDFSRLQNLQYELNATNATAANLPSTLLELVVPGYSTISQLAFRILGIDIGVLVSWLEYKICLRL
jgi:hypothetical protein